MANDAKLDALKAEKDRLEASIKRIETDGVNSSSWDGKWTVTRVELDRLRYERDLVNFRILQRTAWLNNRDALFGGSLKRTLVRSADNGDT